MRGPDAAAIEAALLAVPGVAAASVHDDDRPGSVGSLRLTLVAGADETVVAAAVAEVLARDFDLSVDSEAVAVADGPPGRHARPAPPHLSVVREPWMQAVLDEPLPSIGSVPETPRRLRVDRLSVASSGLTVTAEVELSGPTGAATGHGSAAASGTGVLRATAMAAADAVEQLAGGAARFAVEQVVEVALGMDRMVLVDVALVTTMGTQRLTGVAAIRDDARQSAVRAVLHAVNRRVDTLLS